MGLIRDQLNQTTEETSRQVAERAGSFLRALSGDDRAEIEKLVAEMVQSDADELARRCSEFGVEVSPDAVGIDAILPFFEVAQELGIDEAMELSLPQLDARLRDKMNAIVNAERLRRLALSRLSPEGALSGDGAPVKSHSGDARQAALAVLTAPQKAAVETLLENHYATSDDDLTEYVTEGENPRGAVAKLICRINEKWKSEGIPARINRTGRNPVRNQVEFF